MSTSMPENSMLSEVADLVEPRAITTSFSKRPLVMFEAASAMEASTAQDAYKFAELTRLLQLNQNGMPLGLWQADKVLCKLDNLPQSTFGGPDLGALPVDAWMPLDYSEGFPIIAQTGQPIWERLPGETVHFHRMFDSYLQSSERNTAVTAAKLFKDDGDADATPLLLKSLHSLYYWDFRARGYDAFLSVTHDRRRKLFAREMSDIHYTKAKKIADKCFNHFDNDSNFEQLDGGEIIQLLKASVHIQRGAIGADNNAKGHSIHINTNINTNAPAESGDSGAMTSGGFLERALQDPEVAAAAQQLAIKLQMRNREQQNQNEPRRRNRALINGELQEVTDVDLTTPGLENLAEHEFTNTDELDEQEQAQEQAPNSEG